MAKFKVTGVVNKGADWKLVDLEENGIETIGVSVNRVGKNGDVFPNFDAIDVGAEIEGVYWRSTTGKDYLFPPRPQNAARPAGGTAAGANRSKAIRESQELKGAMIQRSQDVKELGIKIAGAMRDATLITVASLKDQPFPTDEEFKAEWEKWRDYFIAQYDEQRNSRDK